MPDEVKLEPCPELVELPDNWSFWLDDAALILRCSGTTEHADKVRDVAIVLRAIEATRPTAATDDVVKELRRLVDEWDGTKEVNADGLYLFTEALVGAVRAALARTGVTLNG